MILAILCLGTIMAGVVMFGSKRQGDVVKVTKKRETAQAAYEALAQAVKRVQTMYASESACDPETLTKRLNNLPPLPADPADLGISYGGNDLSYAVAQPSRASPEKENRCTAATGCRQIAVPIDTTVYIVTVNGMTATADARSGDCPRDVTTIEVSVSENRNIFFQRASLTNICSYSACDGAANGGTGTGRGFDTQGLLTLTGSMSSKACTTSYTAVRASKYGGGITEATTNQLGLDDLRWARRYLETGGDAIGETNFFYGLTPAAGENGSCPEASSNGQCSKNCFPNFDLNRDGKNNEADLAIMENFLRGYLTTLPVNELP
jgi:hypothetical protein